MTISDVSCRWPGSSHDATIFANSVIHDKLERGVFGTDSVLLGDSAYAPDYYMCKPLRNPQTYAEKKYQKAQLKTRNIAERTYGALKRKFPCLKYGMRFKLEKTQDVIVACCILYNMIKSTENLNENQQFDEDDINFQRQIGRRLIGNQNQRRNRHLQTHEFLIDQYFVL